MPRGTVKWFNNAKGYGFILPEGGGDDLFVHYSVIEQDGYKTLKAGQSVEFETRAGDKGSHATAVRRTACDDAPEIAAAPLKPRRRRPARPSPGSDGARHDRDAPPSGAPIPDGIAAAMLAAGDD